MNTGNKRLVLIVSFVAILLLTPFIAMQFTNEVHWTLLDFAAAAFLLLGTGFLCELIMRKVKNVRYRIIICSALLVMLVLVWAELAVGISEPPLQALNKTRINTISRW